MADASWGSCDWSIGAGEGYERDRVSEMSPGRGVEYREWTEPWGEPVRSRGSTVDRGPCVKGVWSGEGMVGMV